MDKDIEKIIDWNSTSFFQWAGIRLLEAKGGYARAELDVQEHHRGGGGTPAINGGIIAYMFDGLLGAAVASSKPEMTGHLTVNLSINYLRMLQVARRVVGTARVTRHGEHLAFAEGEIIDEKGTVCATCTGVYFLSPSNGRLPLSKAQDAGTTVE